ncbi:MAG: nucleotidyltransferase domain-containing protein [Candidatus Desantisbacteria bacterium]
MTLSKFFKEKAEDYAIDMVFLYGSWSRGIPNENSDVDIAISFLQKLFLNDDKVFEIITDISLKLSVEFNKEVNIIPLYEDFRKPMLYYNAIVLGTPIYVGNFERYVDLNNQAIVQMEDFNIFGKKWQLEISRKNLEVLQYA